MSKDETLPCVLNGYRLYIDENGFVYQSQKHYLKELEVHPLDTLLSRFRSMHMRIAWLANAYPDCMFEISELAQVTAESYKQDKANILRLLKKAVKLAVGNPIALKISRLKLDSFRVF